MKAAFKMFVLPIAILAVAGKMLIGKTADQIFGAPSYVEC